MSVSYFVRYDIHTVPKLARWPGLRRVALHTPVEWSDTRPVNRGRSVLLAQLERAEARADMANFPPFEGAVTHQAFTGAEAWRKP